MNHFKSIHNFNQNLNYSAKSPPSGFKPDSA